MSQLADFRVDDVATAVEIGQRVWVKVIAAEGDKISLSMKYCDQNDGRDLVSFVCIYAIYRATLC